MEALVLLKERPPHLVVTDIRMPCINGIELLRAIKQINPATPVVMFITSYHDLSVEAAHDLGAVGILPKPFTKEEFLAKVDACASPNFSGQLPSSVETPAQFSGSIAERALGRGGFLAEMEAEVSVGSKVDFSIQIEFDVHPLQLDGNGEVRWVKKRADGSRLVGIEFLNLTPESRIIFLAWLEVRRPVPYIPMAA